jgi:GNAT superfamily N-acetyltransferase
VPSHRLLINMLPSTDNVHIEQIRPELTWRLRRSALYPGKPLYEMEMPVDADGIHFGVFYQDRLAGVVSLFQSSTSFQFRKFAVEPALQNQGIGTQLLQYLVSFALQHGGRRVWCNARLTAVNFYLKAGFIQTGNAFVKNGIAYIAMEKTGQ